MCRDSRDNAAMPAIPLGAQAGRYRGDLGDELRKQAINEVGGAIDRAAAAPLRERVEHRLHQAGDRLQEMYRIKQLLEEHPEFEKFLELLRLVDRNGLR